MPSEGFKRARTRTIYIWYARVYIYREREKGGICVRYVCFSLFISLLSRRREECAREGEALNFDANHARRALFLRVRARMN